MLIVFYPYQSNIFSHRTPYKSKNQKTGVLFSQNEPKTPARENYLILYLTFSLKLL
jgi:hypothetical protein